jgi:hypothetical protein
MHFTSGTKMKTNPSGAAAPLNEEGFNAVADRCCQAEMKVFIERVAVANNLQVCHESGLNGFVPYHSCGAADRSFDKLVSELLSSSASDCPWVQQEDVTCQPLSPTCPEFPAAPPAAHCQCNRTKAASVDLADVKVNQNNLGGQGPDSGVEEIRLVGKGKPSAGVTSTGELFDIVITTDRADYNSGKDSGLWGTDFAVIFVKATQSTGIEGNFKFSFVQPGTNNPVTVPEIHMSVFDLDGDPNWEVASSSGYAGYVTVPDTNLVASSLPGGRTQFTGTANMDANGMKNNGANALTENEKKASVMYFYKDVANFELQFSRTKQGGPSGLLFAFSSSLNELCEE